MIIRRIPAQSGAQRRRVAAYCRVSTLLDGQEESFAVQRRHYERRIRENGEWEYAGVYGDCGLSGAFERAARACSLKRRASTAWTPPAT